MLPAHDKIPSPIKKPYTITNKRQSAKKKKKVLKKPAQGQTTTAPSLPFRPSFPLLQVPQCFWLKAESPGGQLLCIARWLSLVQLLEQGTEPWGLLPHPLRHLQRRRGSKWPWWCGSIILLRSWAACYRMQLCLPGLHNNPSESQIWIVKGSVSECGSASLTHLVPASPILRGQ